MMIARNFAGKQLRKTCKSSIGVMSYAVILKHGKMEVLIAMFTKGIGLMFKI